MAFIVVKECTVCKKKLTEKQNNLGINCCSGKCEKVWEGQFYGGKEDIEKAIGKLKEQHEKKKRRIFEILVKRTTDLYHQIGKQKIWEAQNDEVCDLCETEVLLIIKRMEKEFCGGKNGK